MTPSFSGPPTALELRDVSLSIERRHEQPLRLVQGVDLELRVGERLALVGESGSGKSVLARSLLNLDPEIHRDGELRIGDQVVPAGDEKAMRSIRGRRIAMVFQNPMGALDPLMSIGAQISEPLRARGVSRRQALLQAADLLGELGIHDARRRLSAYPYEFSGGMQQRVALAMALAAEPEILVADEPTTALDVRAQEQVMDVLDRTARNRQLSVILITHDLSLVAGFADRVAVMYAGRIVQVDTVDALFSAPAHPYARGLLSAVPRTDRTARRLPTIEGVIPPVSNRPSGCVFHPRCPMAMAVCSIQEPRRTSLPSGGHVSCHLFSESGLAEEGPTEADASDSESRREAS